MRTLRNRFPVRFLVAVALSVAALGSVMAFTDRSDERIEWTPREMTLPKSNLDETFAKVAALEAFDAVWRDHIDREIDGDLLEEAFGVEGRRFKVGVAGAGNTDAWLRKQGRDARSMLANAKVAEADIEALLSQYPNCRLVDGTYRDDFEILVVGSVRGESLVVATIDQNGRLSILKK